MGSLMMPNHLKEDLSSDAFGTLLEGRPEENAATVMKFIVENNPPKIVVVGDFTLNTFLKAGLVPNLGIFDGQTKRIPYDFPKIEAEVVKNPAGAITDEAVAFIKHALMRRRHQKVMMAVRGEEDLLALPAIMYAPLGSLVIYGLPDRGMLMIIADKKTKEKIVSVISQFRRED